MFKDTRITRNGISKVAVVEYFDDPSTTAKMRKRKKIDDEVFDIHDSVSDNAKMISLILSFLESIYNVLTPAQQADIPEDDKVLLEYMLNNMTDRDDIKNSDEIDSLLDRQERAINA